MNIKNLEYYAHNPCGAWVDFKTKGRMYTLARDNTEWYIAYSDGEFEHQGKCDSWDEYVINKIYIKVSPWKSKKKIIG